MAKKKRIEMKNTYFWDIETSNIKIDNTDETMQVTFLSNILNMDVQTGEIVDSIFNRTIREVIDEFQSIKEPSIVWVHNLDYEFSFLLREGRLSLNEGKDNFMRGLHAPLQVNFNEIPNVTFRDTYALFNCGVKELGEQIMERKSGIKIKDMTDEQYAHYTDLYGKLDYEYHKVRMPWDNLDEIDYRYNKRDNEIVAESIRYYMNKFNYDIQGIPLTFTSQVRKERKKFITGNYSVMKENGKMSNPLLKFYYDKNAFFTDYHTVTKFMRLYQGGLTASIKTETGKLITNDNTSGVLGVDIKSSYPNQMLTQKFPRFDKSQWLYGYYANTMFHKYVKNKYYMATVTFKNIRTKNDGYILPISRSQIGIGADKKPNYHIDSTFYNGKLVSSEWVTMPINNLDLDTISKVYEWDEIECHEILVANRLTFLREEETAFILYYFLRKELGIDKATAKLIINSMYGVKVANPFQSVYEIVDGEIQEDGFYKKNRSTKPGVKVTPTTEEEKMTLYNDFVEDLSLYGGSLDVYSDGVFITSYARRQLVEMQTYIVDNGGHVVYSDTDSIKFYCNTLQELKTLCNDITSKNKAKMKYNKGLQRFKQFQEKFNKSDEEMDILSTIGIWEIEDMNEDKTEIAPHQAFKTFGAKKYGYVNHEGKVKTTIAGCSKKTIPKVIEKLAKNCNLSIIEAFDTVFDVGVTFDETCSGRTVATRENRPHEEMYNLTYEGTPIEQFGGTEITNTTYSLGITDEDITLIGVDCFNIFKFSVNIDGEVNFVKPKKKGQ